MTQDITITFTKDQYMALLKIVYLGDWIANACANSDDEVDEEIRSIEQHVYSHARTLGFGDLIKQDQGEYHPTRAMEESLSVIIDAYNEENFWEDLVYRLAERDCAAAYRQEFEQMTIEERFKREDPFIQKYDEEFETHGLWRLAVDPSLKPLDG